MIMDEPTDNLREKISRLRIEASKKKVQASKHNLKCRSLQKKSSQVSLDIIKCQEEIQRLMARKKHFESKAQELEKKFSGDKNMDFASREVEQCERKAMELLKKSKAFERKIKEELKRMNDCSKKAKEFLKKREEAMKEFKELEMEATRLEIKLGIKK